MITIRAADSDDARSIARVQVQTWRSAYRGIVADDFLDAFSVDDRTGRWAEIMQRPEQITFVAEIEEHGIIGFANGGPERDGREAFRGELYGLYVLPDWHGQEIGRRLVAMFAGWLIDSEFDSMVVWVLADNPFRRFYERLGGKFAAENEIQIGQRILGEVAYGWDDLESLANASRPSD